MHLGDYTRMLDPWLLPEEAEGDAAAVAEVRLLSSDGRTVPGDLMERALRAHLRSTPNDWRLLSAFARQIRARTGAMPLDVWKAALSLQFADPRETAVQGTVARELLIADAQSGIAPSSEIHCAAALSDTPGEAAITSFLRRLASAMKDRVGQFNGFADRALAAWPGSPMALYFAAKSRFDAEDPKAALALLEERPDIVESADYLAMHYMLCLRAVGRWDDVRAFLARYFASHDSELWRDPDFNARQKDAIGRGIPAILLISQPKSGTVFTQTTLSDGLRAPKLAITPRGLTREVHHIIPQLCASLSRGGAVCAEHLTPDRAGLAELARHGVTRFVLNLRDPRQAALSWLYHNVSDEVTSIPRAQLLRERELQSDPEILEARYLSSLRRWGDFQEDWLRFIDGNEAFEVLVTDFEELKHDELGFFGRILTFYNLTWDDFDQSVLKVDKKQRAGHFRRGEAREWETVLSKVTLARVDDYVSGLPLLSRLIAERDRDFNAARPPHATSPGI